MSKVFWRAVVVMAMIAYPAIVYFGLNIFGARWLALLLLIFTLCRVLLQRREKALNPLIVAGVVAALTVILPALWFDKVVFLKAYPVLMSAGFFAVFFVSLFKPPTMIERLATLIEKDPPPVLRSYMRNVTKIWCAFFLINGSISLYSAIGEDFAFWALYNGFLAYMLMGLLFVGEFLVRIQFRRKYLL